MARSKERWKLWKEVLVPVERVPMQMHQLCPFLYLNSNALLPVHGSQRDDNTKKPTSDCKGSTSSIGSLCRCQWCINLWSWWVATYISYYSSTRSVESTRLDQPGLRGRSNIDHSFSREIDGHWSVELMWAGEGRVEAKLSSQLIYNLRFNFTHTIVLVKTIERGYVPVGTHAQVNINL